MPQSIIKGNSGFNSDDAVVNDTNSLKYRRSVPVPLEDNDENSTVATEEQNLYGRLVLTGTLTKEQELVISDDERFIQVKNETAYPVKIVTASGTGVHVPSGATFSLRVNLSSEVETNGDVNEIVINELKGDGTTITYPFNLSESDFYSIGFVGYRASADEVRRGVSLITYKDIEDYPTNWQVACNTSSTGTNVNYDVIRSSDTTASVSGTNAGIASITYTLKDGVTY